VFRNQRAKPFDFGKQFVGIHPGDPFFIVLCFLEHAKPSAPSDRGSIKNRSGASGRLPGLMLL